MDKDKWCDRIKQNTEQVRTYRPAFDDIIEALAAILEQRDYVMKCYKESGGEPVITHTNKAGADNLAKNPYLTLWADLNTQALAYWRDLGLTPSGLRKLSNETIVNFNDADPLVEFLKNAK